MFGCLLINVTLVSTTGVAANRKKWRVQLRFGGQYHYLGNFDTEEAAARAYDAEATRLWVNPVLNFLPDGSLNPDRKKGSCNRLMEPQQQQQQAESQQEEGGKGIGSSSSSGGGGSQEEGGGRTRTAGVPCRASEVRARATVNA